LVGPVGLRYLQRLLPPAWLAVCVLAASTFWMAASTHDLIAFTACALALSGVLVHWPRRRQSRWPLVRLLALAAVVALAWAPALATHPLLRTALYALSALCVAQALRHIVQAVRLSLRLQRSAQALDDDRLLALLPPEAREHARQWQGGDDSRSAELGQVVQLAALWQAMTSVGACSAAPDSPTVV
jgi:hypothetical protein